MKGQTLSYIIFELMQLMYQCNNDHILYNYADCEFDICLIYLQLKVLIVVCDIE